MLLGNNAVGEIPNIFVVNLVKTVAFYVNAFTMNSGVSQYLSPITLVKCVQLDFNNPIQVIFGEYA